MRRRQLLAGLGGAAAIWPLRAVALPQAPAFGAAHEDGSQPGDEEILEPELPIIDPRAAAGLVARRYLHRRRWRAAVADGAEETLCQSPRHNWCRR